MHTIQATLKVPLRKLDCSTMEVVISATRKHEKPGAMAGF
jgi:hypothetical protein